MLHIDAMARGALSVAVMAVTLSFAGTGYAQQDARPSKAGAVNSTAASLTAEEQAAIKTMSQTLPRLKPTPLNLADKTHHAFFTGMSRLAGKTVESDPEFARFLEYTTTYHTQNGQPDPKLVFLADGRKLNAQGEPTDYPVGPVSTVTSLELVPNSQNTYAVSGVVSLPDQPQTCTQSLQITDEQGNPQGQPDVISQKLACENVQLYTQAALDPTDKWAKANLLTNWIDQGGVPHVLTVSAEGSAVPTSIVSTDPRDKTGDGMIKFCFGRQSADCDYMPSGTSQQNVNLPIVGNTTYASALVDPKTDPNASVFISITQPTPQAGGGCNLVANVATFLQNFTSLSNNNQTVNWNDPTVQFPAINSTCMPNGSIVYYNMVMNLDLAPSQPTFFGISSAPNTPVSTGYYLQLPQTRIYYSCLVAGTLVDMADGSRKPIEQVAKGDLVLDGTGRAAAVTATFTGEEEKIFNVSLASGKVLRSSGGHVVMTTDGPRLARKLRTGDRVHTREGISDITDITARAEPTKVYNITLAQTEATEDATFYGDGVLVGDNEAQWRYDRPDAGLVAEAAPVIRPAMSDYAKALIKARRDEMAGSTVH